MSAVRRGLFKVLALSLILPGGIREGFTEEGAFEVSLEGLRRNLAGKKEHFGQKDHYLVTRSCV